MKKAYVFTVAITLCVLLLCGCQEPAASPESTSKPASTAAPEPVAESVSEPADVPAPEPAAEPLKPISGSQIRDGRYSVTVKSDSSMFRIVDALLTVEDGEMTATLTMSGQGYGMLYMGTGEEALADTEESYIHFVTDAEGAKTFTVPVAALDKETDCAAWSIKKEEWYDRVLIFESAGIPADAITME